MANRTTWTKRIERWRDSGLTAKEFAAETGLNPRTMAYWKWKLKKEGDVRPPRARPKPAPATFVELAVGDERADVGAAGSGVVLEHRDVQVRLDRGFDETTLRRVLAVLEDRR